jgi:hypothetical protein
MNVVRKNYSATIMVEIIKLNIVLLFQLTVNLSLLLDEDCRSIDDNVLFVV